MTEDQWNEAGCVPRCLLELANRNGNRITKEQFIAVLDKFSTSDGSLDLSAPSFIKILKLLELAAEAKESNNYSVINRDFNAGHKKILVRSEIDLNPGSTKEVKHCS